MARARTGSGKTAAYAVPMLQLLLHRKAVGWVGSPEGGRHEPSAVVRALGWAEVAWPRPRRCYRRSLYNVEYIAFLSGNGHPSRSYLGSSCEPPAH